MGLETIPYDSAEYLDTIEAIEAYLEDAYREGDPVFIADAHRVEARACAMHGLPPPRGEGGSARSVETGGGRAASQQDPHPGPLARAHPPHEGEGK